MRGYDSNMFGLGSMIDKALDLLRSHVPVEGYYVCFSGGKDSEVVLDLVRLSGVRYEAHYNYTTVDPPELVRFVQSEYPGVLIDRPKETMFALIERMMTPPTRLMRYCCRVLKEYGGGGRVCVTGIRSEESQSRSKRSDVEGGEYLGKSYVNPIFRWAADDVWEYIRSRGLKYCELYDQGFERIGCVGCPMTGKHREAEFARYPGIKRAYIAAMSKAIVRRESRWVDPCDGKSRPARWISGEEMFAWWVSQ